MKELAALLVPILADVHPCVCSEDYTGRHLIAPECIHHDTPDEAEWVAARLIDAGVTLAPRPDPDAEFDADQPMDTLIAKAAGVTLDPRPDGSKCVPHDDWWCECGHRYLLTHEDRPAPDAALEAAFHAMDEACKWAASEALNLRTLEAADRHMKGYDALLDATVKAGQAAGLLTNRAALAATPAEKRKAYFDAIPDSEKKKP